MKDNFNLKKFLIENKLTLNSRAVNENEEKLFTFGYDLENIQDVENYLEDTYKEEIDYKKFIGYGDNVMNAVEILNPVLLKDSKLISLIHSCDGEGSFEED